MGYRAPVELVPARAADGDGIEGQAVNLSPAGILVRAPAALAVGADVVCRLPLADGIPPLHGRVARVQPLSAADVEAGDVGLGIAFVDPSAAARAALRCLVDARREGAQPVTVRFQGTNRAVRSSARLTDDGFRLTTPLPFLKLESTVDVAVSLDAPVVTRGVVRRVELAGVGGDADDVPHLIIDVGLTQPPASAARRRLIVRALVGLALALAAAAAFAAFRFLLLAD